MAEIDVTLEGYVDTQAGDFDMAIVLVKPVHRETYHGNVGGIDHVVEGYVIDWSVDGKEPAETDGPMNKSDRRAFARVRRRFLDGKETDRARLRYWKRVIRFDPYAAESSFVEVECIGAGSSIAERP